MKQFILSALFVALLAGFAVAQDITVTPQVLTSNFENVNLAEYNAFDAYISVTNNTNETIELKWLRELVGDYPAEWKTQICDNITCYSAVVSSNIDASIGLNEPFVLGPGETFGNFFMKVIPGSSPGCLVGKVHFSRVSSPDDIITTATFNISVNTPNCFASSTTEPSAIASLRAYPNPTLGQFGITNNPLVKKIVLYNILGKQVKSFQHMNGNEYDISGVPDGLYLVSMLDAKGQALKTVRLTKRDNRP